MSSEDEAVPADGPPDDVPLDDGPPDNTPTVRLTRASIRQAAEQRAVRPPAPETESPGGAVVGVMALLALLVGLAALAGPTATALAVGFAGVVMVWGWAGLVDAPIPRTATFVVGAGVVAIVATVGLTRTEPYLAWVPVALAVSVMAAFLREVFRPHGRPQLTHGMAGSVGALAVATSGATVVALPHDDHGGACALAAMAAVALTALTQLLARWPALRRWLLAIAVVLGAAGSLVVAAAAGGIPVLGAVLVGVLVAAIAHSMLRILLALPEASTLPARVSAAAASVLVVGVLVYVVARVFGA